ncbi:pyruvate dehydrogenase (acetyl-transferring), homodimeric type [Enterobacteriaceae endosymbiont of Neohaemonia nigricornis]|uniref:pyruvate dehydrogenase (acetyl-transferring), homodimeric type n=1 Tax=Enterobacteriaceae endosymbiont of Neohaemonia nigricornis TaxID=2675792 RepID=UPI001448B09C|nr:pyruvate dehydrogenase (acetyl-transferring), homodimeric type [Enterobacteriaceae endosymbiont of Neohaemonia nigricornis]QJC30401.1 pyruvate dehydrogenase (acetyl-transferring), homodimeric type [Enterobacteriaceae endosymbiont of Neohaemonia nigricornis]
MSDEKYNDVDPIETNDWIQSIKYVIKEEGINRAKFLLDKIKNYINYDVNSRNDYINTISLVQEPIYPGNIIIEKKIRNTIRWNAIMIVLRAYKKKLDLGGHISSYQSSAHIYEVCFNHFFQAINKYNHGDIIYFQGHISPGIYARSFLENRLTVKNLDNFRQEICGKGLSSYPHPKLMPNFWQFPTVSMGLGPISAIYQAKFLKYLHNRELQDTSTRKIFAFLGDGEMDEPESKGVINIAAREKLDNLIFIINCNLQRLDGPVYGNGKIINELASFFNGAGWSVIKVIWGNRWEQLISQDNSKKLIHLFNETLDGDFQNFKSKNGNYIRKHFFGKYPETLKLVEHLTDKEIEQLNYGGHDSKKIYAALNLAYKTKNKPTVILMHTIKGYGLGEIAEGKNIAHQIKNIDIKTLKNIRDRLSLNISDNDLCKLPYISFAKKSIEYQYLHDQRKKLGGYIPYRRNHVTDKIILPKLSDFSVLFNTQHNYISTTKAFVKILGLLLRNINLKNKIVPIIADEARTFGMEGLFRQIGIYNSNGLNYTPQDKALLAYYKEDKKGQILQEGINESGAFASWLAAATSYSTNNLIMIPFYIYYSIFGFQRIGDFCWAAGDQQARGFLIGATSGRTTLNGEGLQHADGHSHIQSLTVPNCISYDPAYAYELAIIIYNGLHRMYGEKQENIYFYITTTNENYKMPNIIPTGVEYGICKGIYKLRNIPGKKCCVQLLGSGSILKHVIQAGKILYQEYDISSDIFSVTSFTEIARNGQDCDRWNMLHPMNKRRIPYITQIMKNCPTIATTDYMKIFAEQIRKYIPTNNYFVLGTDGFGRSDSRQNLRDFFEISFPYITLAVLNILLDLNIINNNIIMHFIKKYNIDINKNNPRSS